MSPAFQVDQSAVRYSGLVRHKRFSGGQL